MKDISFIVPVYNTPLEKLEKCLNEILKLEKSFNIEIVVVDDGSKSIIREFLSKNFCGEIKYLYKKNGGVSSARNVGIKNAEGKFIFFADADDIILLEAFNNIDITGDYQFIVFDIDVIENGKENTWKVLKNDAGIIEKEKLLEELVSSDRMNSACSKLFLNECIKQNNIRFDENMVTGEDLNFVVDYTQSVSDIYYVGKSAYCYLREESSRITRIKNFPDKYLNNLNFLQEKLEKLITEYNLGSKYYNLLNINQAETLFNYISDLIILKICTLEIKTNVNKEISKLKISCSDVSVKKKIKYKLLLHENWYIIGIVSYFRKSYLRMK